MERIVSFAISYIRDTINKESIARLIKYLLIFLDILVILGQFDATKPIMSYIAASVVLLRLF